MRGLLSRIWQETRWPVLLFGMGLSLIMALLTWLLPKVLGDIQGIFSRMPFVRPLITALLGVDPGDRMTATMSQGFLWVHPTVLIITWAHAVLYCTRVPAGEIDRGTVDFLLGLPVSRRRLFLSETMGWLGSGFFILTCGYAGHLVSSIWLQPQMRPPVLTTVFVMLNFFAVYLAVGGFSFLISSLSDRRGRAGGVIFAVLLATFLINFVAQFWDPLARFSEPLAGTPAATSGGRLLSGLLGPAGSGEERGDGSEGERTGEEVAGTPARKTFGLARFSVMEYYRPAIIIQSGRFPWSDVGLLLVIAFVCWLTAGLIFSRRNICTV